MAHSSFDAHKLPLEAAAATALNKCMHILWTGDVWLTSRTANVAGQLGMYFLRAYARLAELSHQEGLPRFPLQPKHHLLWHSFHELLTGAASCEFTLNVMVEGCAVDEDFIGKISRITRRCGTRAIIHAAWRKYLISCLQQWRRELLCRRK